MGVLDKIRSYQRQAVTAIQQTEQDTPSTLAISQVGETSQPGNTGHSFLQQFMLRMLEENHVPIAALKFVPGFGDQAHKLLHGDPYQAHTFFANMHYQVGELLRQDAEHDPVELARKQEYAEAEKRAEERRNRSVVSSASGAQHDFGQDWKRKEHSTGHSVETVPGTLSNVAGVDHRQQAALQGSVVNGRSDSQETLQELE